MNNKLKYRFKLIHSVTKDILEGYFTQQHIDSYNREEGYNIYSFVNKEYHDRTRKRHLKGEDIEFIRALFVDMDYPDFLEPTKENIERYPGKEVGKRYNSKKQYSSKEAFIDEAKGFPLAPSKIIDSGNGVHVYWYVTKDFPVERFEDYQRALADYFNTDSVCDLVRVMRYPWTVNHRYDRQEHAILIEENDNVYAIYDFEKLFPEVNVKNGTKKRPGRPPKSVNVGNIQVQPSLPEWFSAVLEINPDLNNHFYHTEKLPKTKSQQDVSLACKLITNGCSEQDFLQILSNTPHALSKYINQRDSVNYAERTRDFVLHKLNIPNLEEKHELRWKLTQNIGHSVCVILTDESLFCVKPEITTEKDKGNGQNNL